MEDILKIRETQEMTNATEKQLNIVLDTRWDDLQDLIANKAALVKVLARVQMQIDCLTILKIKQ